MKRQHLAQLRVIMHAGCALRRLREAHFAENKLEVFCKTSWSHPWIQITILRAASQAF